METKLRLKAWMDSQGIDDEQLVARLREHHHHDCSHHTISAIKRGVRKPGLAIAVAIERETAGWDEGPILASDWTDLAKGAA